MPFRFNHKDLAVLAIQSGDIFDKEGVLWFKEKEGKLLNKRENFSERLCRLKGNMLFYFKGRDKTTECSGIIVLERFKVIPDSTNKKYGFIIEFNDPEEQRYEFAASSKDEYKEWISKFNLASYEKLQKRLFDLRNEILIKTGQDPLPDYHPIAQAVDFKDRCLKDRPVSLFSPYSPESSGDEVMMEMCIASWVYMSSYCLCCFSSWCRRRNRKIACSALENEGDSPPCAMIKVYTISPPNTEWIKHSQTEVSDETHDPNFLRTIIFTNKFDEFTRLKFVVYDVLNKSKSDTVKIGQAVCTIQEIQQAHSWRLSLSVMNIDRSVGTLFIQGWERESHGLVKGSMPVTFDVHDAKVESGKSSEITKTYTTNVVSRSFHFPTKDEKDIKFQELLAESTLCFKIPKQLLNLFIAEEKNGVVELHHIGQLHPAWERVQQVVQNYHFDLVHQYSTNLADLCQFEDMNFKRSVDKSKKELEFIPTNLHVQRTCVNEVDKDHVYDVITVGAPAAHTMKYKHGGLKRLLANAEETAKKQLQGSGKEEKRKTGYIKAAHVKDVLKRISSEIELLKEMIKKSFEERDCEKLSEASSLLSAKVGELLGLYATPFIIESAERMLAARTSSPELHTKAGVFVSNTEDSTVKNIFWEWNGTEFKPTHKKQTESSDCGVYEALNEFMSSMSYTCKTETFSNIAELSNLLEKLEMCLCSLSKKINVTMRFVLMENEADCAGLKELRYRRDVVFSQALTPVVSGFAIMLSRRLNDKLFLEQITNIGLLVHYESLLATYGDENGMLEDMYIGVQDLKDVFFKIVSKESDSFPTVSGKRSSIVVEFSIKPKQFLQLPKKLQERQLIRLYPVLFSMGINEQATLAERFGDTTLQELINTENLASLIIYFSALSNFNPECVESLTKLMDLFKSTVNMKKSKNYDILLISEELCYRMNGVRLTSCKSAKDRSSMAVTLEAVRTLQREHNMDERVADRVLSSVRSQGVRLINSYKNVGLPKYAFNKVQVKALPSIYRPPDGTIGKYLQT